MLRVLQHYLPIRTALLYFGELAILTIVIGAGMSQHLWEMLGGLRTDEYPRIRVALGELGLEAEGAFWLCILSGFAISLICQVAIGFNQLYEFSISNSRYERAARFVESAGAGIALSLLVVGLSHVWGLGRVLNFPGLGLTQKLQGLVGSLVTGFSLLYFWRIAYHALMRSMNLNQRVLVIGSRGPAHEITNLVLEHPEAGFDLVGMVPEPAPDARDARRRREGDDPVEAPGHVETSASRELVLDGVKILEDVVNRGAAMSSAESERSLLNLARSMKIDMLVVALEDRRRLLPIRELLACRLGGVDVREREDLFEQITGKIAVAAMRPSYLIFNEGFRRHFWADLMKRTVDVAVSLLILVIFFPVMILTAIVIKLDSPGPALFKQERVGQDGKPFTVMKFRSMRADAEKLTGPVWSSEDDPRITKVGRFVRKTRLDELPQLFNILAGSMSIVGPRPERQHFVDELGRRIPYYNQRHIVKPGLTGWAQINYPYGNTVEDSLHKLQYDLFYIKNHSVLFDLSILFSTIKTVLLRQGT